MTAVDLALQAAAMPLRPGVSLAVGPWTAGPVSEVGEFDQGQLVLTLNEGHQLSFTIPGRSPSAVLSDGLVTDVWLSVDDELTGRFRMLPLTQTWGPSGEDDVTVNAVSYKRLLAWRFLHSALTYSQVDQGDIVWNLVAHTQAQEGGSLGITKGVTATGVKRDRTYLIGDNIAELGSNLSNVDKGCWWDVDPWRVLEARMYASFPFHPTPLGLGTNCLGLSRVPSTEFANAAMASGSDEQTVPVWVRTGGLLTDPRGRWEAVTSSPSTIIQNTLTEHAVGLLSRTSRPPAVWRAEVEPRRWRADSAYRPGDRVTVLVPASTVDPTGVLRQTVAAQVTEVAVAFDGHGDLAITVTATEGVAGGEE